MTTCTTGRRAPADRDTAVNRRLSWGLDRVPRSTSWAMSIDNRGSTATPWPALTARVEQQHVIGLPAHLRLEACRPAGGPDGEPAGGGVGRHHPVGLGELIQVPPAAPAEPAGWGEQHQRLGRQRYRDQVVGHGDRLVVVLVDERDVDVAGEQLRRLSAGSAVCTRSRIRDDSRAGRGSPRRRSWRPRWPPWPARPRPTTSPCRRSRSAPGFVQQRRGWRPPAHQRPPGPGQRHPARGAVEQTRCPPPAPAPSVAARPRRRSDPSVRAAAAIEPRRATSRSRRSRPTSNPGSVMFLGPRCDPPDAPRKLAIGFADDTMAQSISNACDAEELAWPD